MKRSNVAIFVPHAGCPNRCSFCDQRTISGTAFFPDADFVRGCCDTALRTMKNPAESEIAFFGGSFTAISRPLMTMLLDAAAPYIKRGDFRGIRISTRPDCIDAELLELLRTAGVTSIELGAQSLDDDVLKKNLRGHTAKDIADSCRLIREAGFEAGLQIMPGLYGSTREAELSSIDEIIGVKPDTIRIYPVSVLKGTLLEQLWRSGEYRLRDFDDILSVCAEMVRSFISAGISVLRCGLHASDEVAQNAVAGYYHPAFGELCDGLIYRDVLDKLKPHSEILSVLVAKGCIGMAIGHKRANAEYFAAKGLRLIVRESDALKKYEVRLFPHK